MRPSSEAISFHEQLFVSPTEKFFQYGIPPIKLVLHLLLVMFTSLQIVLIVSMNVSYSRAQNLMWNRLFWDVDGDVDQTADNTDTQITNSYVLYTTDELKSFVHDTTHKYFTISNYTFNEYYLIGNEDGYLPDEESKSIDMWVYYYDNKDSDFEYHYEIENRLDIPKALLDDPLTFLDRVKYFQLQFTIVHKIPKRLGLISDWYEWKIIQNYDFDMHGPITVALTNERSKNFDGISGWTHSGNVEYQYFWLSLMVMIIAAILLGLSFKHFVQRWNQIDRQAHGSFVSHFSAKERIGLFNWWLIISVIGNLFQIYGSLIQISTQGQLLSTTEKTLGIGWAIAWVCSLQYLRFDDELYVVMLTMKATATILIKYIIGVAPVYMAYSFIGVALFWQSNYFNNLINSIITIFGLMQQDSVLDIWTTVNAVDTFWGLLYMFTLLIISIDILHNIFILIILDAYRWVNEKNEKKKKRNLKMKEASSFREFKRQETKQILTEAILESDEQSEVDDTTNRINYMNEIQEQIEHKIYRIREIANPDASVECDRQALHDRQTELLDVELREFLIERTRTLK